MAPWLGPTTACSPSSLLLEPILEASRSPNGEFANEKDATAMMSGPWKPARVVKMPKRVFHSNKKELSSVEA